jgi:RHS repeat-associated protein
VEYTYDGQGALVKRTMADGSWTVYIGGIYEKHSDGTYVKYYSALGRRIAMRDNAGVVHYILADHLGSSTVITNSTGAVVGTMKYYPYGAMRSTTGNMPTDKLFTGQQREPETVSALGLYNYGARFYSTLVGRFVSADPLVASPGDPQVLNRYSYVRNNPLIFVDPSGLTMAVVCGMGQNCEGEDDENPEIGGYREWVIQYWMWWLGLSHQQAERRWNDLVAAAPGMSQSAMAAQFDVFFIETNPSGNFAEALLDWDEMKDDVRNDLLYPGELRSYDVVLGFSLGGALLNDVVAELAASRTSFVLVAIRVLILVQPGFQIPTQTRHLDAADLPYTRVITANDPGSSWSGNVTNAINIIDRQCRGHCEMQQSADLVMALAYFLPPGATPELDAAVVRFLRDLGTEACIENGPEEVACGK